MFESSIDGQKNKRGVDVGEHQHDGEGAVKEVPHRLVGEVQVLQEAIQHAVAAKNGFPSVAAHKVADPERHDDELVEKFPAPARVKSQIVRERITKQDGAERYGSCYSHGAEKHLGIERIREESFVVVEIPMMNDHAFTHRPQAVCKHQRVGKQKKRANPDEWREGNERFVGPRVHGRVVSLYSRTRVASQSEKTKSCSPASGPRAGTRTRNVWPFPQSTSSNSLEPP